jgi:hypothetical protein
MVDRMAETYTNTANPDKIRVCGIMRNSGNEFPSSSDQQRYPK